MASDRDLRAGVTGNPNFVITEFSEVL